MSKILVTGGAGYIGSILVPQLVLEGHEVVVFDKFLRSQTSLLYFTRFQNLEVIKGDVRDAAAVKSALRGVEYILALAAVVGMPACDADPIAAKTTNTEAIHMLLKLRSHNQRIIFPCTNSGYGIGEKDIFCTEDTLLRPISLYGQTKVEAEKAILDAGNSISLRLATVFGVSPAMRTDLLVNYLVLRAVTDGYVVLFEAHFKRNYVYIRDVAQAFLYCINNWDRMKNEVYNAGLSEANLSKEQLCQEIKRQVPKFYFHEAPVGEDVDKRNYIVSNTKIEKAGFKATTSLQDGIAELIKAYKFYVTPRRTI